MDISTLLPIIGGILVLIFGGVGAYKYNSSSSSDGDVITNSTTGNDGSMGNGSTSSTPDYPEDTSYGTNDDVITDTPRGGGGSSGTFTPPVVDERWKLIPYKQVGPINVNFTEEDLISTFGATNVTRETVGRRYGETIPATILFPDSKNQITIEWLDGKPYQRIKNLRIEGEGSSWQTAEGIRIGTTFEELERINQRPFKFYGFDWEYEGKADDWQGGNVHKYMTVYLTPKNPKAVYPAMLGDSLFLSNHPKAYEAGFYVTSIEIRM